MKMLASSELASEDVDKIEETKDIKLNSKELSPSFEGPSKLLSIIVVNEAENSQTNQSQVLDLSSQSFLILRSEELEIEELQKTP
jgi:hypothetical protein